MFNVGTIKYNTKHEDGVYCSTQVRDLICIQYYDTEAGSNPREFQGVTTTNIKILKSILEDSHRFWSKHLGVSVTIKGGINNYEEQTLKYEDACITNGLQSLSIFRILIMIKIYQEYKNKNEIHTRISDKSVEKFKDSIRDYLPTDVADFFLSTVTIKQINAVLNWFHNEHNKKYIILFNSYSIEDLLNIKVNFKSVILDEIVNIDEDDDFDKISEWGEEIASANNETQNVKVDDKFGTKYKCWFEENVITNVTNIVNVEYRKFSKLKEGIPTKHILEILRAIIPTTLIIDCTQIEDIKYNMAGVISKYANNRTPVYNLFEKFIYVSKADKDNINFSNCIEIIRNLMPHIINYMLIIDSRVKCYYTKLTFEDVLRSTNQNSESLKIRLGIMQDEDNEQELNKIVRKQLRFSPSNIFPIFIFATRKSIIINEKLEVQYDIDDNTIDEMIDKIYKIILKKRIIRQYGSTSDLFRDSEIYYESSEAYEMWTKRKYKEDVIYPYRINLLNY